MPSGLPRHVSRRDLTENGNLREQTPNKTGSLTAQGRDALFRIPRSRDGTASGNVSQLTTTRQSGGKGQGRQGISPLRSYAPLKHGLSDHRPGEEEKNMSSWFEKGRPALFQALAAVCDQIDTDLGAGTSDPLNGRVIRLT